jgi:hypothetical protein
MKDCKTDKKGGQNNARLRSAADSYIPRLFYRPTGMSLCEFGSAYPALWPVNIIISPGKLRLAWSITQRCAFTSAAGAADMADITICFDNQLPDLFRYAHLRFIKMLDTTIQAIQAVLAADQSVDTEERKNLVQMLKKGVRKARKADAGPAKDRVVSRKAVAERFGVCVKTIANWQERGVIQAVRVPGAKTPGYRESDVDALIAGRMEDIQGCTVGKGDSHV